MGSELLCPVTAEPCTYREHLEELHRPIETPFVVNGVDMRASDCRKLQRRLMEHTVAARLTGCPGMQEGVCPTAEKMSESPSRGAARRVLRILTRK